MDCIFPSKLTAGLTFTKLVDLAAYHAPDWVLSIALRGPQRIDLTATAEGVSHRLACDATTTGAWLPGEYWYSARVTGAGGVHEVDSGQVVILADLTQAGDGYDGSTHAQKVLAAIKAVIERRASQDQERYRINNRELYKTPIEDLLKLRSVYEAEVAREQRAARGLPLFRQVRVRF